MKIFLINSSSGKSAHIPSLSLVQSCHHVPRLHLPLTGPLLLTVCPLPHLTPLRQAVLVHILPQIRHLRVVAKIYRTVTNPLHLARPTHSMSFQSHYQDQYHLSVLHVRHYVNSHPDPYFFNQQLCEVT